jgi:serine/threonine-protein kinase RsbW/sigma-B regulation protein RsbU (phosphoserine phosphatase)
LPNSHTSVGASPVLRLTLPNAAASLETARLALLDFLAGHALPARALFRVELVLEETLMNLLWHAFPQGGEHAIELTAQVCPDAVVLGFSDDGVPFDPLQQPLAARPSSLQAAVPGGLGLRLLRHAVREARYERFEGRNLLRLQIALDR